MVRLFPAPFPSKSTNLAHAVWGGDGGGYGRWRAGDDGFFPVHSDLRDQSPHIAAFEGWGSIQEPLFEGGGDAGGLLLRESLPKLGQVRFHRGKKPGAFVAPGGQVFDLGPYLPHVGQAAIGHRTI